MKLGAILDALRGGATLHFSIVKGPHWWLAAGTTVKPVSSTQVRALIKRGAIVSVGDSLFSNIPAQTWRFTDDARLLTGGGAP
jgi:hypothetical protein